MPLNVQFGCGGNLLEGWMNCDREVDITKRLPFDDNSVDRILAEHVCEHVTGPDFLRFLDECRRILKPGGTLRICMPVLTGVSLEAARDLIVNHGHLCGYDGLVIHLFLRVAGFKLDNIRETGRAAIDGHWQVIGKEKDDAETCRMEAIK